MKNDPVVRGNVQAIEARPHAQVIIIGGGINGMAAFRDLALQGIDVILVERGDYSQGASGSSSHMIHGGIRYLENGEFRLVKESVVERNRLLKLAPHYVKPLQTTIPIVSKARGFLAAPLKFLSGGRYKGAPYERGAYLIKAGLIAYDSFSGAGKTVPKHSFAGRGESHRILPMLNDKFNYTATYYDGSIHQPERLVLDLLRDAEAAGTLTTGFADASSRRARCANYLEVVGHDESGIQLRDAISGTKFSLTADVILNMTGAWSDLTNELLGNSTHFMGGTRGSHIVLDHPGLLEAVKEREIFFENDEDSRIVLIYPLLERILVGTTDIDADMSQDAIIADEEIDYFFDMIQQIFPTIPVSEEHIVYTYSGVRPLPSHDRQSPGAVSRDYRIEKQLTCHKNGTNQKARIPVLTLVGGKWTTFRALSEHITNDTLALLGHKRTVRTRKLPIGGGRNYPINQAERSAWLEQHSSKNTSRTQAEILFQRYGTRAGDVIEYLEAGKDRVFSSAAELSDRQIEYMVRHEHIGHLVDVLVRRTSLAFQGKITEELYEELADCLGNILGWNGLQQQEEIKHAKGNLAYFHRITATVSGSKLLA